MPRARPKARPSVGGVTVVQEYDVAADAKKRISLRKARTKYFNVKALSNGCYILEPRVLVPPQTLPARVRKTLDRSVPSLKKGMPSPPMKVIPFLKK
jgi:hypothetical protein